MNLWTNLKRIGYIVKVLVHHGLIYLTIARVAQWPWLAPYLPKDDVPGPERLRRLFEELGGTFIKLGQMLALQPDVLPLDYCNALFKLLDRIDPFSFAGAEQTFQEQFGLAPDDIFDSFERTPLATASIGQVYLAHLDGQKLAVKVRRPRVEAEFAGDMYLMAATFAIIRSLRLKKLYFLIEPLSEFINWTREELDFRFETRYMEQLRRNAADSTTEYIPYVVPEYSTDRVLTMEFLEGMTLLNYIRAWENGNELLIRRMRSAGFDPDQFARHVVDNFLHDAFQYGVFHADLHPANLMILPDNVVGYIDFGITGVISPYLRHHLIALTLAYSRGDIDGMFSAFFKVSALGPDADVVAFRRGIQILSNDWYRIQDHEGHRLKSITSVMLDMLHLSRRTGVWPARNVIKYIRSVVAIDGLITRFAPDFDMDDYVASVCNRQIKWRTLQQFLTYETLIKWFYANGQLFNSGASRIVSGLDTLGATRTPMSDPAPGSAEVHEDTARQIVQMAAMVFVLVLLLNITDTRIELGVNLFTAEVLLLLAAAMNLARHLWRAT